MPITISLIHYGTTMADLIAWQNWRTNNYQDVRQIYKKIKESKWPIAMDFESFMRNIYWRVSGKSYVDRCRECRMLKLVVAIDCPDCGKRFTFRSDSDLTRHSATDYHRRRTGLIEKQIT
jgi:predicted RNA-binding Zn-ribbon protein involved in translation (DUF1610 family)